MALGTAWGWWWEETFHHSTLDGKKHGKPIYFWKKYWNILNDVKVHWTSLRLCQAPSTCRVSRKWWRIIMCTLFCTQCQWHPKSSFFRRGTLTFQKRGNMVRTVVFQQTFSTVATSSRFWSMGMKPIVKLLMYVLQKVLIRLHPLAFNLWMGRTRCSLSFLSWLLWNIVTLGLKMFVSITFHSFIHLEFWSLTFSQGHQRSWDWGRQSFHWGVGKLPLHPVQLQEACPRRAIHLWIIECMTQTHFVLHIFPICQWDDFSIIDDSNHTDWWHQQNLLKSTELTHFGQPSGLANRRSEKQKPSCLDYVLTFREAARIKQGTAPHQSLRDTVWVVVSEYNKSVSKDMGWKHCSHVILMFQSRILFEFWHEIVQCSVIIQRTLRTGEWKMIFGV